MGNAAIKILSYCLKAIRRVMVVTLGSTLSLWIRLAERCGLSYWAFFSEALGMVPFTFGWQLRQYVYQRLGVCLGENVILNHGTTIGERPTTIGSDVWTSRDVYIELAHIGDHVLIGPGAVVLAGRYHHRIDSVDVPIKQQGNNPIVPIKIDEGAWIGANATVMADVGRHAIVGAGAVVLKPVPDYAVVAGNPARFIRDRREAIEAATAAPEIESNLNQSELLAAEEPLLMKTE
jgi:acetyltransferase-like isoleucine patch superfamily enzyme